MNTNETMIETPATPAMEAATQQDFERYIEVRDTDNALRAERDELSKRVKLGLQEGVEYATDDYVAELQSKTTRVVDVHQLIEKYGMEVIGNMLTINYGAMKEAIKNGVIAAEDYDAASTYAPATPHLILRPVAQGSTDATGQA